MSEPIEDLEITVTLRNNQIKRRRLARGMTQGQLAEVCGVTKGTIGHWESLYSHGRQKNPDAGWTETALRAAAFFDCKPEELFPEWLSLIKNRKVIREVGASDAMLLAPLDAPKQIPSEALETADEIEALRPAIARLPDRLRRILMMRLDGQTLTAIGAGLGISGEYCRQLEQRALRNLRHSPESRELAENRGIEWTNGRPIRPMFSGTYKSR